MLWYALRVPTTGRRQHMKGKFASDPLYFLGMGLLGFGFAYMAYHMVRWIG